MVVYSGVLDCGHPWCNSAYFLLLLLLLLPQSRHNCVRLLKKMLLPKVCLSKRLSGVQTIKAQNAENTVRWRWQRSYSSFMSESFRTLIISISTGTAGQFLSQLTGLLTLWVGAYLVISWRIHYWSAYCFPDHFWICGWSIDQSCH